jgi:DnaJ-domain-containing protein 1
MADTTNTFNSLKPDMKEQYSDKKKKKDRFKRTKSMMAPKGKATAEARASKDPMKALKDKSFLNIKNAKGVAV